jgi:hypothetical protein
MNKGLLEKIMTRRYGEPVLSTRHGLQARCWNLHTPDDSGALYVGMKWTEPWASRYASLKELYGDIFGGFLVKNTLKVAVLLPREVWGLWNIEELRVQPYVQYALEKDPDIDYFMDENGVLYFGIKGGQLYVFDIETDELDCLGPVEQALETLMDEQEALWRELP